MKIYNLIPTNEGGLKMYESIIKKIVNCWGGYREKEILKNPHTVTKSDTWNNEHKVLTISELETGEDGYRYGFQVDLITMSICG